MNEANQALWDVIKTALIIMMMTQILGQVWDYWFRVLPSVAYECDFQLADHVVTMPCEIRNVTFSDN